MSQFKIIALLSITAFFYAADSAAKLPDQLGKSWIECLRSNDLAAGYALLPHNDQVRVDREWLRFITPANPSLDFQLNFLLNIAQSPTSSEQVSAIIAPFIGQVDPATLSQEVGELTSFLDLAAKSQEPGVTPSLDYAGLHAWVDDLAAFIAHMKLNDQEKIKQVATHLINAIRSTHIKDAAQLRGLDLLTLLKSLSPALKDIKQAFTVYDIQLDGLLDSFTFTLADATPASATLTIAFTALDKPRSFPLKLISREGSWQLEDGANNPITALSQLVMMALLTQGMATTPAQTTAEPVSDGAL